ncbi:MAG TPA: ABC transporter substrate-binding protein, partial [Chloroflexota bacterium]|nr:ABC transporter substrate-binding protein [Chloroflexota bacterium]
MRMFKRWAMLAVGIVALSSLTAWGSRPSPLVRSHSPSAIRIGGIFVMSGDPTLVSLPILNGYELGFRQANAGGGVHGHQIDYLTQDDGYDPSKTTSAARKLVENDGVLAMAGVFGSDDSNALIPYLDAQKVPFVDPIGGGANVAGKSWVWQSEPSYSLEGKVIGDYLAAKLHVHKVAVVYQTGANEPENAAIKAVFGPKHISMITVPYGANAQDMSSQVSQVQGYNPNIAVLLGTPLPTSIFVKDAAAIGYKPPKGYLANYPEGDPGWLGITAGDANGSLVSSYADLTGNNPVAKAYKAAIKKFGKNGKYNGFAYS